MNPDTVVVGGMVRRPARNFPHFFPVVDFMGNGVSVWMISPFQGPLVRPGGQCFRLDTCFLRVFISDFNCLHVSQQQLFPRVATRQSSTYVFCLVASSLSFLMSKARGNKGSYPRENGRLATVLCHWNSLILSLGLR